MATYQRLRYLLMTTDPVHVGSGGYRLGRVDNSIVRETGTRIPKIPGTSLHGAARHYAARIYQTPGAAGQDHGAVKAPEENPVCYTFGYIQTKKAQEGEEKQTFSYAGMANLFDARILLFPVNSMFGPVWVGTRERLEDAGFSVQGLPDSWPKDSAFFSWERGDSLNLGWLMLGAGGRVSVSAPEKWASESRWEAVKDRIVLVSDALFGHIVNGNLEVRTSVAIEPERGAAKDGALFTYEAIPRATFLSLEAVIDDYRDGQNGRPFPAEKAKYGDGDALPGGPWSGPADVMAAGLRMIEWLGVGGMGTRGFGRLALVGEPVVEDGEGRS